MNLSKFFNPKSIAVIGASNHPEKVGYALMKNLRDFKGEVIPINPKLEYKSVLDYKKQIDLAIIAIPADFVAKVLIECGKKKIKNVIVITSGFSEVGNIKQEKKLEQIANKFKINLLGPNCFGIANPYKNLDTTFSKAKANKGEIAFISQSGALWSYIADLGIPIRSYASLGNPIGLDFDDFIEHFSKDRKTKAIVLYIEKLTRGKRFLEIAKKCKKPIYTIKAGKSKEGSKAAFSHTGSLATDYKVYQGMFKQAKIIPSNSLLEAFQLASKKQLIQIKNQKLNLSKQNPITIITNAGGAGVLVADYLADKDMQIKGPYDLLGTALAKDYKQALIKHKKSKSIIAIVTPQTMTDTTNIAETIIQTRKENIIVCMLGKQSTTQACNLLKNARIPCFQTIEELKNSI